VSHKNLPLLYAEVESKRFSNSSIEWEEEKNESIVDLFDYYYKEEVKQKNIFNIEDLEKEQYQQLQKLLKQNL
ncbi:18620_t:CDS:2, partial [Gigaspora margarita]